MTKRIMLFSLLLALVAPPTALAGQELPALTYGEWTLKCAGSRPEPGRCGIYWAIRIEGEDEPGFTAMAAGYDRKRLVLGALSTREICAQPASTMQIDGYPEVVLHPEAGEEAVAVPEKLSEEILRQARGGTMMFLRIHAGPACTPADHAVPLTGFNDAWNQLPQ